MAASTHSANGIATLASIEQRVLWLAVRIVDYANRLRPDAIATAALVALEP